MGSPPTMSEITKCGAWNSECWVTACSFHSLVSSLFGAECPGCSVHMQTQAPREGPGLEVPSGLPPHPHPRASSMPCSLRLAGHWGRRMPNCGQKESLWSPQNITNELLQIQPEKAHSTAECEAFVQALPGSGSAPLLRTRVEDTNRRYEHLVQLLDLAQEKWVSGGQQGGQLGSEG